MSEENIDWDRLCLIPSKRSEIESNRIMGEEGSKTHEEADVSTVLESLDDGKCRKILQALYEPKSANTLCDECGFPTSTMYRKLELLRDANLVREYTEVRRDGPNVTLYERNFTNISIGIDEVDEFTLEIDRSEKSPEDRFATFWSEMKKES